MDVRKLYHALVIVIAVGLAALYLVYGWRALLAASVAVFLFALTAIPIRMTAASRLPNKPQDAQRWLNRLWPTRVVPLGWVAALPIWLGARLGDQFGTNLSKRTAAQVIGVAIAYATIELTKAVDQDGNAIDAWIGERSKRIFTGHLGRQFDNRQPPGPLPHLAPNLANQMVPSELWLLVHDTYNTGWEHDVRGKRARRLQLLLDGLPQPIGWHP
jgi:hypothetical protein